MEELGWEFFLPSWDSLYQGGGSLEDSNKVNLYLQRALSPTKEKLATPELCRTINPSKNSPWAQYPSHTKTPGMWHPPGLALLNHSPQQTSPVSPSGAAGDG